VPKTYKPYFALPAVNECPACGNLMRNVAGMMSCLHCSS
jgi:hypothetical protein